MKFGGRTLVLVGIIASGACLILRANDDVQQLSSTEAKMTALEHAIAKRLKDFGPNDTMAKGLRRQLEAEREKHNEQRLSHALRVLGSVDGTNRERQESVNVIIAEFNELRDRIQRLEQAVSYRIAPLH